MVGRISPEFLDKRTWAKSLDRDQMPQCGFRSRFMLFATYPAVLYI